MNLEIRGRDAARRARAGVERVDVPNASLVVAGRQRRRQAKLTAAVVGAVLVVTGGSVAIARERGRSSSPRLQVQPTTPIRTTNPNPTSLSIGPTTTTRPFRDYPNDLVGGDSSIRLLRTGVYTWTSLVVLPFIPSEFNWSYRLGGTGTAQVNNFKARLVPAKGGYSLRVTFSVNRVTGAPTLQPVGHANGPYVPYVPTSAGARASAR